MYVHRLGYVISQLKQASPSIIAGDSSSSTGEGDCVSQHKVGETCGSRNVALRKGAIPPSHKARSGEDHVCLFCYLEEYMETIVLPPESKLY